MPAVNVLCQCSKFILGLLLLSIIFAVCHSESETVEDLKDVYEVLQNAKEGSVLLLAKLPYKETKRIDIPLFLLKPLQTSGEILGDGTFRVILKDSLDYKAKDYTYTLDLRFYGANDIQLGTKRIQIKVLQVNMHIPRFKAYDDTFQLDEEYKGGGYGPLLNLIATDADDKDEISYSLKNPEDLDGKFDLDNFDDRAVLKNTEKFDYETKTYYRIEVIAMDNIRNKIKYGGQHTSTATIHVNVIDIDDQPPIFQKECGVNKVKENMITSFTKVHAIDGDRGINHPIGYSLANNSFYEFFDVTKETGGDAVVAVTNAIDREDPRFITNPILTFSIQADEYQDKELVTKVENRSALSICTVIIEDINDNPPTFSSQKYLATVKENTQVGIPVNFPNTEPYVVDIDEGENAMFELYLINDNGTFSVTPVEGINNVSFLLRVLNDTALDYEREDLAEPKHLQLKIVAKEKTEENRHTATASIIVELQDENDNFPQFTSPEKANISENASKGDFVAKIEAIDIDSSWFGTAGIRYSLMPSIVSKNFSLDPVTGRLTVSPDGHGFDRETVEIHYLTVEARDNNGTGNRNTTQLQIELIDANDNAPIFKFSSYRAQLMENSDQFIEPLILEATDRDKEGTPNSEVRYRVSGGEHKELFHIDSEKGILTPLKPLDFEDENTTPPVNQPCISTCTKTYKLFITAYDLGIPQQSTDVAADITLMDENDNIPRFITLDVTATINETSAEGTYVTDVEAVDDDISPLYKTVSYNIKQGGEGNFVVDRNSGRITVARNADLDVSYNKERKRHQLVIEASDPMMNSSTTDVVVNVRDINDKKPKFDAINSAEYELLENVNNVFIGIFPAYDPDETALLMYSINHEETIALKPDLLTRVDEKYLDYLDIFKINDEGELWVMNPADREEMKQISLQLKVVDLNAEVNLPQEDTLRIRVTILDENDNDPMFVNNNTVFGYRSSVQENVKGVTLLNVHAIDIDENNTITYTIEGDEKVHRHFRMDLTSGELRIVQEADYEEDQYFKFTAVATDSGVPSRSASAGIVIEIIDQNDNSPEFQNQSYATSIEEHVPSGTFVIQVNATDRDSGEYGLVYFRIPRIDPDDYYFEIEKETGIITVKEDLDREVQEVFRINVVAYDNPSDPTNQNTDSAKVMVTLIDINDHAPEIDAIDNCVKIPETTVVRTDVVKITATDKDKENTPNSEIEFFVEESDYFDIELSGTLFLNASVRNLHTKLYVVVMAKDKGDPPLNTTKSFCIEVYDMNTHNPKFVRPLSNVTDAIAVDEKTDEKSKVYQFNATDEDNNKETNGKVTYRLITDVEGSFVIDSDTGSLTVNAKLDKATTPTYEIEVEACDNGEPKLCAKNARLDIFIRSDTDTKPHFNKSRAAEVSFTEHSTPGKEEQYVPIAELKKDYVENISLPICYYIVGGDAEFFTLVKDTRNLTLAKEVDREVTAFYSIIVQADLDCLNEPQEVDRASSSRPDVIEIRVRIIDINDNAPIFDRKEFTGGIKTKDKAGKHVLTVHATDADEGENAVVTYHVVGEVQINSGEGLDKVPIYFILNETTGAVILAFQPTADMKGHFTFNVMAKDIGNLHDTAVVSIYLMRSEHQVKLIISKDVNEITEEDIAQLQTILMNVTGLIVNIDDIQPYSGADPRHKGFTEVFIHCVDRSTNEVMLSDDAVRMIDQHYMELVKRLQSVGLVGGEKYIEVEKEKTFWEKYLDHILYGIIGFLSFIIFLVLIVYFVRINSYKRFLKAATAQAFGPNDTALNDFRKTAVPNTNLHAIQGSNPIWNQEDNLIKKICEDDSLSENGSTNSLDVNVIEPPNIETEECSNNYLLPNTEGHSKDNPLFNNEDEEILQNQRNSVDLSPESPSVFGIPDYARQKSTDLGSRSDVLRNIDSDWRRRLTNGSITRIRSENFTFGTAKFDESEHL